MKYSTVVGLLVLGVLFGASPAAAGSRPVTGAWPDSDFVDGGMFNVAVENAGLVSPSSSQCVSVPGTSAGDVAVVNITNTNATGRGWGALRASEATPVFNRPAADQYSSVNFAANTPPNPNLAVSPVGADGKVCYDGANASHNVILDLSAVIPSANVNATDPERILDTRGKAVVSPSSSQCVSVPGTSAGDVAVVNITNTNATGRGWGALRASEATPVFNRPAADQYSSVNFAANTPPNPNLAVSPVGADGKVCYDGANASHNVILDLSAVIPSANVNATDPERILDTRGKAVVSPSSSQCVSVPGTSAGDVAVVNITNTNATGRGWGALRASEATPVFNRPAADQYSSVNFAANTPPNPNLAVSPVGADGKVCYDGANASHNVILDLSAVIPSANVNATDPERILDTRPPDICSSAAIRRDLGESTFVVDGLCVNNWALVNDCIGPCGDSRYLAEFRDGRWAPSIRFPTGLCRSEAAERGIPNRILDRVGWACAVAPDMTDPFSVAQAFVDAYSNSNFLLYSRLVAFDDVLLNVGLIRGRTYTVKQCIVEGDGRTCSDFVDGSLSFIVGLELNSQNEWRVNDARSI